MNEKVKEWLWLIRIFFPEQRKWASRALTTAGLAMLAGPVWTPYADAAVEHFFGIKMPAQQLNITGWGLLALGLLLLSVNVYLDHRSRSDAVLASDVADRMTLEGLFSQLHLPSLDFFVDRGKLSFTYVPVLHYFAGLEACVNASTFYVHDLALRAVIGDLYASLSNALSYGEYFVETPNNKIQKFDSKRDVHIDPDARRAHDGFISAVYATEKHLRDLCGKVKSKFPDFDFSATSRAALEDYKSYEQRDLSDFELSVLRAILDMEEGRLYPNLRELARRLESRQAALQVALDKLIEIGFVKHLYPGLPHQKFTVLKGGRAHYTIHSARLEG